MSLLHQDRETDADASHLTISKSHEGCIGGMKEVLLAKAAGCTTRCSSFLVALHFVSHSVENCCSMLE